LASLEEAYNKASDAFKKDQADSVKKAYIEATVKLATATMNAPELSPKEKYPKALKLYRLALQFDPENAEAKESSETIVEIYKSMGRPVPE
jgi:tetratricopeptide (TPR) repeat protein